MRPSVAARDLVRRESASLLLGLGLALPASAGDRALLDIIGYSEDSRFLVFEEFGIQDGSGFAYSNLYAVDLLEDSWVVGTPLRMRASDEGTSLAEIRNEALANAEGLLTELEITVPADVIALLGDGVPEQDGRSLRFGLPGYEPGAVRGDHELELETFPTAAASPCFDWFAVEPLGYELTLTAGGKKRLLHRDDTLPRSRGCPQDYRIHAVAVPFNSAEGKGATAILSVYPFGFEGPDRRFVAVPLGL